MANEDRSTRYQRLRRRAATATALVDGALLAGALASGLSRALADALTASDTPALDRHTRPSCSRWWARAPC